MSADVVPAREEQSGPTIQRSRVDDAWDAWDRFFFAPASTATLAVVRITYGTLLTLWTITLGPDLRAFFMASGTFPEHPDRNWTTGVLEWFPSDTAVVALWAVMLVAAICLTIGFQTRLVAVLCAVAVLSFQRRNPYVFNSGDLLVRQIAFYLALAPAGVALSLDAWLRDRRSVWHFPQRAQWPLRLLQIEVSLGYLWSMWAKVRGTMWNDGTALNYALRIVDLQRVPLPDFVFDSVLLLNLMTFGTLVLELCIALFVWNRRLRPYVLIAGAFMYLMIDLTITVGFFSFAIFVAYLAFVPGDAMERWLGRLRERRGRRREAAASSA